MVAGVSNIGFCSRIFSPLFQGVNVIERFANDFESAGIHRSDSMEMELEIFFWLHIFCLHFWSSDFSPDFFIEKISLYGENFF